MVIAALWWVTDTYPNYDSYYHLVWGRELFHGISPSLGAYAAPTHHPLFTLITGVLGAIFGESADRVLILICLVSQALSIVAIYRLGKEFFGTRTAMVAAGCLAISASFWLYALRGYVDSVFVATVLWSALCVIGRRRALAAILLVTSGLLRPEGWLLIALYGTGQFYATDRIQKRLSIVGLTLLAPAVWLLGDLLLTGDPLHSLHGTTELAHRLSRETGASAVPAALASSIAATIRLPILLCAVAGTILAIRRYGAKPLCVPLILIAAGTVTFTAIGALGMPILPRYLTVPSAALCLFAGYGVDQALIYLESHSQRWALRLLVSVAIFGVLIGLAIRTISPAGVRGELVFISDSHHALIDLLDDPKVIAARACGPLTFPTYRLVPDTRWHLDLPRSKVGARSAARRRHGVAVYARSRKSIERYGRAAGTSPRVNDVESSYSLVVKNRYFSAYANCD